MKKVLKVFVLVLIVFCMVVSCTKKASSSGSSGVSASNDTDGSGGVAAGSGNETGGGGNASTSNAGNSNSGAKNGIKITVNNLSDWGRIYLFLYDKDIFKTVAEAYGDIEDGKADLYFYKTGDENVPWTTPGEYYIRKFIDFTAWYTDGKSFVELDLARIDTFPREDGTKIERLYFFDFDDNERFKNLPTFNLKENGNVIDEKKFTDVPEYGEN